MRTVREMTFEECEIAIRYFLDSDEDFLRLMGVEPAKLPTFEAWREKLRPEFAAADPDKQLFYVAWLLDGKLVGHSHINKIQYGEEAHMHLHVWMPDLRGQGHGTHFVRESARLYFDRFHLKRLYSEPAARNPAPNRTLARAGFEFEKTIDYAASWINYVQPMNRWRITPERLKSGAGSLA